MNFAKEFLEGFVQGFKKFGLKFSNFVNYILLSIVYFFGIGLTSIVAKLLGKNFLDLKPKSRGESYWVIREIKEQTLEDHYRQF